MSQLGLGMTTVTQEPRRSGKRGGGVAVLIAAGVVLGLVAVVVIVFLRLFSSSSPDYTGSGHGEVVIQIMIGANLDQIGQTLQDADVVKSGATFVSVASADPNGQDIQPGTYKMHSQMSSAAALAMLLDPSARISKRAVIPEGLRVDETVRLLARATGISVAEFDAVLSKPGSLGLPVYARANPEGFLFPATYDVVPGNTALGVLSAMVTRFGVSATAVDLVHRAPAVHLTPNQVVILASLVQAEGTPADFPMIARTILNRLAIGMKLQLNSTVNYVLRNGKAKLSLTDIAVQSPYNTYLFPGLPPGPIDSPGQAALAAVLSPATGNWIYFVTVNPKTGETKFTNSYAEFLTFKAELTANGG